MLTDFSSTHIYNIIGSSLNNNKYSSSKYVFFNADIRDKKQVESLFQSSTPDIVINTSALSVPDYCESHHEEAWSTNVTAVENLAEYCEKYQSKLIHLSTDFVFDGNTDKLYTEKDSPNPINYYGITKWESEKKVESICSSYAIVRVVVVYGKSLPGQHGNIVQLVVNKLRAKEQLYVVSDQFRTATFVNDISQGIERLFFHPENGIYHICGSECLSISEIAYRVADYLHLDKSLICPITTEQMHEATPRPRFSGLNIDKARNELKYTPHSLEEALEVLYH
jgi:dTDP-4-dehydrorhamnose reductase